MSFTDFLHYLAVGNPVCKTIIRSVASIFNKLGSGAAVNEAPKMSRKALTSVLPPLWKMAEGSYYFVRLAGLSGATAVILGAVGSHYSFIQEKPDLRNVFETANRFHFFHSIALLAMPLAKYPLLSGTLMFSGIFLFSGTLYYRAFTGKQPPFRRLAPLGGSCLILAWLSLLL